MRKAVSLFLLVCLVLVYPNIVAADHLKLNMTDLYIIAIETIVDNSFGTTLEVIQNDLPLRLEDSIDADSPMLIKMTLSPKDYLISLKNKDDKDIRVYRIDKHEDRYIVRLKKCDQCNSYKDLCSIKRKMVPDSTGKRLTEYTVINNEPNKTVIYCIEKKDKEISIKEKGSAGFKLIVKYAENVTDNGKEFTLLDSANHEITKFEIDEDKVKIDFKSEVARIFNATTNAATIDTVYLFNTSINSVTIDSATINSTDTVELKDYKLTATGIVKTDYVPPLNYSILKSSQETNKLIKDIKKYGVTLPPPDVEKLTSSQINGTINPFPTTSQAESGNYTFYYQLKEDLKPNERLTITTPDNREAHYKVTGKSWWSIRAGEAYLLGDKDVRTIVLLRVVNPARDIDKDLTEFWAFETSTMWKRLKYQFANRFDWNIGTTILKGGDKNSNIQNKTFLLAGASWQLHKYFDLAGGWALANDGGQWYAGISMDLRMFVDLAQVLAGNPVIDKDSQ
ncbi:MAG: hypothetical protein HZA78_04205 [Candidatus Schekmanbacteria bacterium]|nr:hypothetical protein [Candidatus Schekmanbacteria bacterium]